MKHPHTSQSGSVIIYAILTLSAMLALSLALTGLLVGRLQIEKAQRNAVVAIYAADSALEKCLYEARKNQTVPALSLQVPAPQAGFLYAVASVSSVGAPVVVTDNCKVLGATSFKFRSTGTFNSTQRTIEITQ